MPSETNSARAGQAELHKFLHTNLKSNASRLDKEFPCGTRSDFIIPSVHGLQQEPLKATNGQLSGAESTYLCGNSLGVQPKSVSTFVNDQLARWAQKGVYGHFQPSQSRIPPWLHLDDALQHQTARIVGAEPSEVIVMGTLTANLHLMMSSFYKPTQKRYKIIFEERAFPSDHFAIESQIEHHGFSSKEGMVLIKPPKGKNSPLLPTEHVLSIIDQHAEETALLLLPGIQYYTGQWFDMEKITAHAKQKGITVGWDLAHAVGNVPVKLHDWDVDFAVWCNYKYMNCGPGATGGLFVHSKHTLPNPTSNGATSPTPQAHRPPRLAGWWGSAKHTRFTMDNVYNPIPGASGFQLSNPSALDLAAVLASLSVFSKTSITDLRQRSLRLTSFLEEALDTAAELVASSLPPAASTGDAHTTTAATPFDIITPRDPAQRGAQLSIRLAREGIMDAVLERLEGAGVVIDERKPDVIRVAPAPLYNTFADCARFVEVFALAVHEAIAA